MTIAIVDSGIDLDSPEFAGRISAASRSFESRYATCGTCAPETITFDLDDVQGHGTLVASVAAGARDGQAMHGVAFDATIMALKIAGPDLDGVGGGGPLQEGGVNGAAIAPAIRHAVENGAFVINLSVNGDASGQIALDQRAAMDLVRANDRLVVQSVSNHTGQDSFAGQMTENFVGSDFANRDWFLFGIGLDSNLNPRSENGNPGALADRTLAVPANFVMAVGINNEPQPVAGNSFAAPAIAGAAALLKQYWPQLGGRDISQILLSSATDLGAPGVDLIYGAGLLNIEAALNAQAPGIGTSAAKLSSVSATSVAFSPAFGGASAQAAFGALAGTAMVLDRFGRDYALDVRHLAGSIEAQGISLAALAQPHRHDQIGEALPEMTAFNASSATDGPRPLPSGSFAFRVGPTTSVHGTVNGSIDSSGAITGSMLRSSGIATFGQAFSIRSGGHSFGLGYARSERGLQSSETGSVNVALRSGFTLGFTSNREIGAALGMRGSGAFDIEGARSSFVTAGWSGTLAGFRLSGEAMAGHSRVRTRDAMIDFLEPVLSSGFRVKAAHGLFDGLASLGVTSPLRVERARLRYALPARYDLETRELVNELRDINLTPDARELNVEAGWSRAFGQSLLSLGAAFGVNSGHQRDRQSGAGWIQLSTQF